MYLRNLLSTIIILNLLVSCAYAKGAISIEKQGSFMVGGSVISTPGEYNSKQWQDPQGQTRHGDHAYVFYQIPTQPNKYPVVFLQGAWQSSKTWESTPDGRDGFQNLFLKNGYSVYLVDQPRRGKAGQGTTSQTITPTTTDQFCFDISRLGLWPNFYKNVQFPQSQEALNQFFRQTTPNTGNYDEQIISDSMSQLFNKIGDGVLVTHSQGGGPGWLTAIKNPKVRGIVSFEPGSGYIFPKGEAPETMTSSAGTLAPVEIELEDFIKLTKIPIVIFYGDNIPKSLTGIPGQDNWFMRLEMAKLWVGAINKKGGNAKLVHLPELGIYGNTHFMFSDLNNKQIAELVFKFLSENKLK